MTAQLFCVESLKDLKVAIDNGDFAGRTHPSKLLLFILRIYTGNLDGSRTGSVMSLELILPVLSSRASHQGGYDNAFSSLGNKTTHVTS